MKNLWIIVSGFLAASGITYKTDLKARGENSEAKTLRNQKVSPIEEGKDVSFEALDRYSTSISITVAGHSYNKHH